uniref:Uncharacterized protein n=1 Tax=Myotis myotis TaxID=51298 RepID=A0A7J7UCX1_MYOMY|nr:hypothetical protein mMyoMyo1_008770 [Myotis myotis]
MHKVKEKMKVSLCTGPHCSSSCQAMFQCESAVRCVTFYVDFKRSHNAAFYTRHFHLMILLSSLYDCEVYSILFTGSGWFIEQMHWNMTSFCIVRFFLAFCFVLFFVLGGNAGTWPCAWFCVLLR